MLPETGTLLKQEFKIVRQPSRTFRLDLEHQRIQGEIEGTDAVKQAVYCILNTERFDWLIYSWNYGVELKNLFGKPRGLVKSKLKKRIREALMQEDRILGVEAFSFEESGQSLRVTFTVRTGFGEFQAEKEVSI